MEYKQFYKSFRSEMHRLRAADPASAATIERASKMFQEFAKYNLLSDRRTLEKFVYATYDYFLLILKHAKHWGQIPSYECLLNVKIALNSFLSVVNATKTISNVILCLSKYIFDILIKQCEEFDFQEFLKLYVSCLNNSPKCILDKLPSRHKNLHLLPNILRETHEINMQTAIVAMLMKLPYNSETSQLEIIFPEVKSLVAGLVNYDYYKIRMVLEELNKNSTKIFSIKCKELLLDFKPVLESKRAIIENGFWLDVDLPFKRISFFCTPFILSKYTLGEKFGSTTNWEYVSFKPEDCLETSFFRSYDETNTEILEMYFRIKIAKTNLFRNDVNDDRILQLLFTISKYSEKYDTFIKVILPQLFPYFVPRNFAYTLSNPSPDQMSNKNFPFLSKLLGDSKSPEVELPHSTQESESNTKENMLFDFNSLSEEIMDENQNHAQTMRPSMCAFDTQELEIKEEPCSPPTAKDDCEKQSSFRDDQFLERIIFGNENAASESGVQEKNKENVGKFDDKSLKTCNEMEIKEEPSSSSTEKTPAAKSDCKKEVRDPSIFRNVNAAMKSGVQEYKNEANDGELVNKSQKTCDKKVAVISALSVSSSSTPYRVPVATPLNERKRAVTATQNSAKRLKENEDASNVKITSNIVINKEADKNILQPKPSNAEMNNFENLPRCHCCMLANSKNCSLLDFVSNLTRNNK